MSNCGWRRYGSQHARAAPRTPVDAFHLDLGLDGEDEEGRGQRVGGARNGHAALLLGFEPIPDACRARIGRQRCQGMGNGPCNPGQARRAVSTDDRARNPHGGRAPQGGVAGSLAPPARAGAAPVGASRPQARGARRRGAMWGNGHRRDSIVGRSKGGLAPAGCAGA